MLFIGRGGKTQNSWNYNGGDHLESVLILGVFTLYFRHLYAFFGANFSEAKIMLIVTFFPCLPLPFLRNQSVKEMMRTTTTTMIK